jgi:3-hydroxyisobutyrate dehydrogenase-like beta-hydroxyacid dehydrogenase
VAGKTKGTVGVVGLGNMGGAFARHLAAAKWRVLGYDIDAGRKRAAARARVEVVRDVKTLAEAAPVIILSLPHPDALDATVAAITGEKLPRKTFVETSTFKIEDKQRAEEALRKAGHVLLDCPVSGTGAQAAVKDIVIYASGSKKAIAKLKPMFAAFSRAAYDVGAFGNGSRMKFVANLLVTINNVASAEAMVLGIKAGLDPQMIYDLIRAGVGTSRVFEVRGPMMVKDRYKNASMSIKLYHKDIAVIDDFASKLHVPTPLFSASVPVYAKALAMGLGEQDTAAVCAVLEKDAGVTRKRGRKKKGSAG